jgi:Xaa-Pro dipeptidase
VFGRQQYRYISGTVIGEWSRDKMSRYALLTGTGDPHIWDFGSAASHHRLHMPWLSAGYVHAGMLGLRGAVAPDAGLMKKAAQQIQYHDRAWRCRYALGRRHHRAAAVL